MAHRLSLEAETELDEIWWYVARESSSAETADRFVVSLIDGFSLIARNPHIGRRRDWDLRRGLRSFPLGEYLILYRLDAEDVLILHVVRGSRDIQHLFGKESR